MNNKMRNTLICVGIAVMCIVTGGIVLESMITGLITFVGLVALIESIGVIKWFVAHTSKLVDIIIFAFGVYAKVHFGVTIALAIMFAGMLFTLQYAPYIRETYNLKSTKLDDYVEKQANNLRNKNK